MCDLENNGKKVWRKDWKGKLGPVVLNFKRVQVREESCELGQ